MTDPHLHGPEFPTPDAEELTKTALDILRGSTDAVPTPPPGEHDGFTFTDRYGGNYPDTATMCRGQCDGMGVYPQNGHDPEMNDWERREIERIRAERDPDDKDPYFFVRCEDCGGTGKRPSDLVLFTAELGIVTPAVEEEVDRALAEIRAEVLRAIALHPPMLSEHEAFAVLEEEVDELKAEVWKSPKRRDYNAMKEEAIHTAAMTVRFLVNRIYRRLEGEGK